MRIWRFPDQVVRLAIVFAAVAAAMITARTMLVPESYGDLGPYRAKAVEIEAARDIKFAGWQTCVTCHFEEGETKSRSYHRTLSCEVCHGPASDHAEAPDARRPFIPREREGCIPCHGYLSSRPTGFPQIVEIDHNPRLSCITCHNPHDPTPPEIPGECSACHAQISRTKAVSPHSSLECVTCHDTPQKHSENPRANLPQKPRERAFCGQCHARGAESPREIPRIDLESHGEQYLCWQCHYPHYPESH